MDLKKIEKTNIYEFRITGKLTENDAKKLNQSFKEFEEKGQKIKLLGIVDKMPLPEDISSVDEIFSLKKSSINVVEKYVILNGRKWLNGLVSVGNFFTPGIPIQSFDKENRAEAMDWLMEDSIEEYAPKDYLSNIEIEQLQPNAFKINISHDKINHSAMTAIYQLFKNEGENRKLNIMVVFESFPSFDSFKAMVTGMKIDLKALGRINKYAVVSDAKWIETFSKIGDFITPGIDMRFFKMDELEQARNWTISN